MESINYTRQKNLHIGKKIAQLREARRISPATIADKLHYHSRRTVYNYESRENIDLHSLLSYCELLGVRIEEILELDSDNTTAIAAEPKIVYSKTLEERVSELEKAVAKLI